MVFENKIAQVLEEEEESESERQSSEWSHPSRLEARPQNKEGPIDIEYVGRSIHSGSSDTHWPIEP